MCDDEYERTIGPQGGIGWQGMSQRGFQGEIGYQSDIIVVGPQGPQGMDGMPTKGVKGIVGVQGLTQQGPMGVIGAIGPENIGAKGLDGVDGLQGDSGPPPSDQGPQGTVGFAASLEGPQGPVGDAGFQGPSLKGPQGIGYDYFGVPLHYSATVDASVGPDFFNYPLPAGRYIAICNGAIKSVNAMTVITFFNNPIQIFTANSWYQVHFQYVVNSASPVVRAISTPGCTLQYDLLIIKCG